MLWLLACAPTPGDPCAAYTGDPAILRHCVVHAASTAPTFEAAGCARAGALDEECREAWIMGHADQPLDTLLAACDSDECRFLALDWAPDPFEAQLARCTRLSRFVDQCVVHAAIRWLAGSPPLEEQRRALGPLGAWDRVLAPNVGFAIRCGLPGDCALLRDEAPVCHAEAEAPADPHACASFFRPEFPRIPPALTPP
jgi:hypothetical protein